VHKLLLDEQTTRDVSFEDNVEAMHMATNRIDLKKWWHCVIQECLHFLSIDSI
jgi:hypothetical protein